MMLDSSSGKEKLQVAIIGSGIGSLVHFTAFKEHPSFNPIIIAATDEEKTKSIANELGIDFTIDWKELLENEAIDMISIASPPDLHAEMVIEVLKAGKHVLCEKPMATSLEDTDLMRKLVNQSGLTAMCNFEFRYIPCRSYFTELLHSNYIGDLYSLNIKIKSSSRINPRTQGFNWFSDKSKGGGILNGLGSHYIDFLLHIFGDIKGVYGRKYIHIPKRLNKSTGRMKSVTAEDSLTVLFDIGGIQCGIYISTVSALSSGTVIEASGSKGTLIIREDEKLYGALIGENNEVIEMPIPSNYLLVRTKNTHILVPPMKRLLDDFISGVSSGLSHSPNFEDGYKVQQVIEAINESHKKKKFIAIKS